MPGGSGCLERLMCFSISGDLIRLERSLPAIHCHLDRRHSILLCFLTFPENSDRELLPKAFSKRFTRPESLPLKSINSLLVDAQDFENTNSV